MAHISQTNNVYTVIVHYTCQPDDQAELMDVLKRTAPAFQQVPGFISLNMHRPQDGQGALVYLQWRDQAASDACFAHPVWAEAGQEMMNKFIMTGRATMNPLPYDIVQTLE